MPSILEWRIAMSKARRVPCAMATGAAVIALALGAAAQQNPYQTIENHFKLPEGRKIGSTAGITVDRGGTSVWVFERCGGQNCVGSSVAPILKFDEWGELLKSFGAGMFIRPHGIHIDRDGNVWVTDGEGPDGKDPRRNGNGHQVFKLSPDGKVLMTLGKAGVAGDGPDTFNAPSAVLVAPNGDIFVGDGHGGNTNARMLKFSKDGKFIKTWGKKGSGPGDFEMPHTLAMDSRGRLFVGDRGNNRIQIFDQNGTYLEEWKQFGRPSGIAIARDDTIYVADSESWGPDEPGWKKGIRVGSARDGSVKLLIEDIESTTEEHSGAEGVGVDREGNVYGAVVRRMMLEKHTPKK